ncbi:DUF1542 domain-containing protein [Staphylococcus argenteus]|nr:DUF1542 domain-containing protein [Staphylococcus argenteus]MDH9762621.1 DUF1542 domain-containing protein [Staphylococcus argenteus]MDH9866235.1 DUF1542 domain-containing protein [Staphylococcus argenteus]
MSKLRDISTDKVNNIRDSAIGSADEKQNAINRINAIVLETIRNINNARSTQQVEDALNRGIASILAVQIVTSEHNKQSTNSDTHVNGNLRIGYGNSITNHPFNNSSTGHKTKRDEDDEIDPLHMRHLGNNFGNIIKNAIGVVGISGLLASFWLFIAKRRRKEDEEEELEIRENSNDKEKDSKDSFKHLPLLFAKRRKKEEEEDLTLEENDERKNSESFNKVKHTPFFMPKRRKKDEEDFEVTNENEDEKSLEDTEHSPLLIAKRRRDKDEEADTTKRTIESNDEDAPLLLAKKKNQKEEQAKVKKSSAKHTNKKVVAKKKKKKSKKNEK